MAIILEKSRVPQDLSEYFEEISFGNIKDVFVINPQPWGRAHYATFPEKLVEPIIKVATSQKGVCPKCGSPWCRVIESKRKSRSELDKDDERYRPNRYEGKHQAIKGNMGEDAGYTESTTLGWRATCDCKWYKIKNKTTIPEPIVDKLKENVRMSIWRNGNVKTVIDGLNDLKEGV